MRICGKAVDGETPGDADVTANAVFLPREDTWHGAMVRSLGLYEGALCA